jgi:branched-chain amino acid transport system ATP-binding protein
MTQLLEIDDLSVQFAGLKALTAVSLHARSGEVKAVIGPNGAGKTTLFNVITGYTKPSSGRIRFRGEEISREPPHLISQRGIRRTFQNGGLFGDITVLENVLCGLHTRTGSGFFGLLFGTRGATAAEREAVARARSLLDMMGIRDVEDRVARDLSGGQQRIVEITRAIASDPSLLLLDEPAVGLTPPARDQLVEVIRRLAGERGVGVLLVEHSIDMVMKGSDLIVVLNGGQRIAEGKPDEIRQNKEVLDAYLGYGSGYSGDSRA